MIVSKNSYQNLAEINSNEEIIRDITIGFSSESFGEKSQTG